MSGASTGRLLLEGLAENVRIYRLYKEEQAREAREEEERRRGRAGRREDRSRDGQGRGDERAEGGEGRSRGSRGAAGGEQRAGRHERRRGARGERERAGGEARGGDTGSGRSRSRRGSGDVCRRSHGEHLVSGALPVGAAGVASAAEGVGERLFGPDGTPFGYLPTRGQGVGLLAHAKTTYQHIKAEQDAGHRSKGPAEKLIHGWLEKRRNAKSNANGTVEEELLVEKNVSSRGERSGRHEDRRKRCRSRSREKEGDVGRGDDPVFVPVVERGKSSGEGGGDGPPSELRRSFEQPAPSVWRPLVPRAPSRAPSRPYSFYNRDGAFETGCESEDVRVGRGPERMPSVHVEPPARPTSVRSSVAPAPSIRGVTSAREVNMNSAIGSRRGSRVPTIRVQSPTPPEQANSVRSPTPSVRGVASRVHSPEPRLRGPAISVRSPAPSRHTAHPPQTPTPPLVAATPYPTAPSVIDMPAPIVPNAPPIPPPPPPPPPRPPPAPVKRPVADPDRDAFLASIQVGVKLKRVSEENRRDASAARKDKSRIEDVAEQAPIYEETPHSHDVEALEHAQAVEERERRQEEERVARSKTPFIAPQPRPKLPVNFQDELTAKLGKMNLNKPSIDSISEAAPSAPTNIIRPRPSNETWRTVYSDHEPYTEPDQAFRERLGSALSARGTSRPTAAAMPVAAPARKVTPDPAVFVNLSADFAEPGWTFENVPKDGQA